MQTFDNPAAIAKAPRIVTDPPLRNLLTNRVQEWTNRGFLDLTHVVLIEVGDTDKAIVDEIAFPPWSIHSTASASERKVSCFPSAGWRITAAGSSSQ